MDWPSSLAIVLFPEPGAPDIWMKSLRDASGLTVCLTMSLIVEVQSDFLWLSVTCWRGGSVIVVV